MNSPTETPAKGGNKLKTYAIGAGVVLLLGAILYFVGLQAGKSQLAAQEAKFGVERNGLQSQLATANAERDAARSRASLMEARGALYRTAIDLDARNFGTANTHLSEAATALDRVQSPDVSALAGEIKGTDLNVAVDLGGQRDKVIGFATQLNKVIPVEAENTPPTADVNADVNGAPPAQP